MQWSYLTGSYTSSRRLVNWLGGGRISLAPAHLHGSAEAIYYLLLAHSTSNREKEATIDLLIPVEASNCAHIFLRTHARSLLSCCGHPRWVAREHAELERILRHFGEQIRRRTGKSRGEEVARIRRSLTLGCSRACRAGLLGDLLGHLGDRIRRKGGEEGEGWGGRRLITARTLPPGTPAVGSDRLPP